MAKSISNEHNRANERVGGGGTSKNGNGKEYPWERRSKRTGEVSKSVNGGEGTQDDNRSRSKSRPSRVKVDRIDLERALIKQTKDYGTVEQVRKTGNWAGSEAFEN